MNDKLFSLEIFIDSLRIFSSEKCIFPSTILKFLHYEPTILSSISTKIKSQLNEYLNLEFKNQNTKNISQIEQLKDGKGNFIIRKGKSILFQSSLISLISELHSIPVYVLVVDDYFAPSHLVGIVSIDLSECIKRLSIKLYEINLGSVSDEIGDKMSVVDLMGRTIGSMACRLRLLCIGDNIAQHIDVGREVEIRERPKVMDSNDQGVGDDEVEILPEKEVKPTLVAVKHAATQATNSSRKIRIQTQLDPLSEAERYSKIGLSIDPCDPLLENPPPMIYNSTYGGTYYSDSDDADSVKSVDHQKLDVNKENIPIANSDQNVTPKTPKSPLKSERKLPKNRINKPLKDIVKTIEKIPVLPADFQHFIDRISRPKPRPRSPTGFVPKGTGWLRAEPSYVGPEKSCLTYKLTKSLIKRMEFNKVRFRIENETVKCHKSSTSTTKSNRPQPAPTKITKKTKPKKENLANRRESSRSSSLSSSSSSLTSSSSTKTKDSATQKPKIVKSSRPICIPPLFNPGTSFSNPTQTTNSDYSPPRSPPSQRPPFSPTKDFRTKPKNRDNQASTFNPTHSNKSPQMTIRSQTSYLDEEDIVMDGKENKNDDANNTTYSDDFTTSHTSNINTHSGKRQMNLSQISQTSEWQTEYSQRSSYLSNDFDNVPPNIDDTKKPAPLVYSPPRSPLKNRRIRNTGGTLYPGGRSNNNSSTTMSYDNFKASYDEMADISSLNRNNISGYYNEDENEDDNDSYKRPSSIGGDLTSYTKVTKYDRSFPTNTNYHSNQYNDYLETGIGDGGNDNYSNTGYGAGMGTNTAVLTTGLSLGSHLLTGPTTVGAGTVNAFHQGINASTVIGSLRTDDSQNVLTSAESYY